LSPEYASTLRGPTPVLEETRFKLVLIIVWRPEDPVYTPAGCRVGFESLESIISRPVTSPDQFGAQKAYLFSGEILGEGEFLEGRLAHL
jgi:hypothetical protein